MSKKDYKPVTYYLILQFIVAIIVAGVIWSMGYTKYALISVLAVLALSLIGLFFIWLFCYLKLAIVAYILIAFYVLNDTIGVVILINKYAILKEKIETREATMEEKKAATK